MEEQRAGGRRSVYQEITNRIVEAIEAGAPRFEMPWHRGHGGAIPTNARTGNPYRGINVVALWASASAGGYGSNIWATYRQWRLLGAQVRRHERGSLVVFYRPREEDEDKYEEDEVDARSPRRLIARASWVFNGDQVDGWATPEKEAPDPVSVIEQADALVRATGAAIKHGGGRAYYAPAADRIQMPARQRFTGTTTMSATEGYYATLLHELVHWTGHASRLKRDFGGRFGDEAYAIEELIAELGAAFLCAELSITNVPRPDHAAYIDSWLMVLRRDIRAIFTAATQAAKAASYLRKPESVQGAASSIGTNA